MSWSKAKAGSTQDVPLSIKAGRAMSAVREANNGKPYAIAEGLILCGFFEFDSREWRRTMVCRFTDIEVSDATEAIRRSGLIEADGRVAATDGWLDDVAFWLDVLIVEGLVEQIRVGP